jgi:hypothetical protein
MITRRMRLTSRSCSAYCPSVTDALDFLFLFDILSIVDIETFEATGEYHFLIILILLVVADPTELLLDLDINSGCIHGPLQLAALRCCTRLGAFQFHHIISRVVA